MAFSWTVTKAYVDSNSGDTVEQGTWDGAAVTTGTITPGDEAKGFPSDGSAPKIQQIQDYTCGNDSAADTITHQVTGGSLRNALTISDFTANATGTYELRSKNSA